MQNVELYGKCNDLPKRDAKAVLEEYSGKMKWRNSGDRIIDVGSGDGSVTVEILKEYLPKNFEELVGSDVNEVMVNHANNCYMEKGTKFLKLDILGELPEKLIGTFDHVFSFYALHWIRDQKTAFKNILNLLTNNGDCLVTFLNDTLVYDQYCVFSRSSKWKQWVKNVEQFLPPYKYSQQPERDLRKVMEKTGFKNIETVCQEKTFLYDIDAFRNMMTVINPFDIPQELFKEYMDEFMEMSLQNAIEVIRDSEGRPESLRISYTLLIAYGAH